MPVNRGFFVGPMPPGSAALLQLDPSIRWATATIVVYADDGDGKFTTVQSGTSNDRVLGVTMDAVDADASAVLDGLAGALDLGAPVP